MLTPPKVASAATDGATLKTATCALLACASSNAC